MPQPLPNWRRHHKLPMRVNGNIFLLNPEFSFHRWVFFFVIENKRLSRVVNKKKEKERNPSNEIVINSPENMLLNSLLIDIQEKD